MEIMKIAGVAIGGVIVAAAVKNFKAELSIYVVLAAVIIIFMMALENLTSVFQFLGTIYGEMTYGKQFFPIMIKVLAVAYLADFTSQLCKDAGESAIGGKVELAGKIIIFYLAMPILLAILDLIHTVL